VGGNESRLPTPRDGQVILRDPFVHLVALRSEGRANSRLALKIETEQSLIANLRWEGPDYNS